jgi:hypothetical protein
MPWLSKTASPQPVFPTQFGTTEKPQRLRRDSPEASNTLWLTKSKSRAQIKQQKTRLREREREREREMPWRTRSDMEGRRELPFVESKFSSSGLIWRSRSEISHRTPLPALENISHVDILRRRVVFRIVNRNFCEGYKQ